MKKVVVSVAVMLMFAGLAHAQDDKYYVLVEKSTGPYELKSITLERPNYQGQTQEILEVPRSKGDRFLPSYEETSEWTYIGNYSYKQFSDDPNLTAAGTYSCALRSDKTKYTPCTSKLTGFINTDFFGLLGNTRFNLQPARLNKLVDEAHLKSEVKACREKNLAVAENTLKDNIVVEPTITDLSGFYDNSKLFDVVPTNYDCIIKNTNEIKYILDAKAAANFNIQIDQTEFPICKDGSNCKFAPSIKILSKNINGLSVSDSFADDSLSLNVDKITNDGTLSMNYFLTNLSKKTVKIESISLYVDDDIIKKELRSEVELAPRQKLATQVMTSSNVNKATAEKINFQLSKKNENKKITIGVAVKYTVDGVQKTMFDSRDYTFKKLSDTI